MPSVGGVSTIHYNPADEGVWGYITGASGTVAIPSKARVLQITMLASDTNIGTLVINNGSAITIPSGSSLTVHPQGNLIGPVLVFNNISTHFIEYVE